MKTNSTYLGSIVRVVGSKLFVELSEELPSSTPIIGGRLYKVGQIGSFVKVSMGSMNIFGIVTMVGSNPISQASNDSEFLYGKTMVRDTINRRKYR